jgi:hypothetical protein
MGGRAIGWDGGKTPPDHRMSPVEESDIGRSGWVGKRANGDAGGSAVENDGGGGEWEWAPPTTNSSLDWWAPRRERRNSPQKQGNSLCMWG